MRYLVAGEGSARPALLLVHGVLGYSFSWRFNLAELAKVATVYAPDMLGMGYSERVPHMDCSLRAHGRRMLEFMDALGIEQADVAGNSHGGAVAMMMAGLANSTPEKRKIRSLILAGTIHPWSEHFRFMVMLAASPVGWLIARYGAHSPQWVDQFYMERMYGDPRRMRPGTLEGYMAGLRIPGTLEHVREVVKLWNQDMASLRQVMARVAEIPSLLVWGSKDIVVPLDTVPALERALPHSQLTVLEGAGHLTYEEVPEDFNARVIGFLKDVAAHG